MVWMIINTELNDLRINYLFEKISSIVLSISFIIREELSNLKRDDDIDLLPQQLWKN